MFSIKHDGYNISSLLFTVDDKFVVSGDGYGRIIVWNYTENKKRSEFKEKHSDAIKKISFTSNFTLLVSCSDDKTIKLWNFKDETLIRTLEGHEYFVFGFSINH